MSNSLASVHPELIPEWSERNLPLTPDKITFGSNKRVWWKGACGHEWETSVKARSKGEKCPICSGARVIEGINDLVTLKPLLAQEWSEKNKLKPTEVSVASHKKIIWKCKHGHEWEASVKSRTINGTGCPYCSHNKVLAGFNDLASQYPDIAAEWSDRNLPLLPTMVTAFANSKAWWKCRDCGNEWYTLISTRAGGSRCPYCSGYTLLKGFNDLATTHPDIAAEWSERNYPLMPDEVNAKSRHNVWWKCKTCGNEWKSVINARVKGTVCPVCADRTVLAGYNDLATTDRKLLAEWDYEKNSLLPTQVSRRSMKRVWWKCSLGHSWKAKISDRTIIGEKCTVCEKEYRSVFPGLAVAYYANQKGLKVQLGSDKLLGIPLETYIPSEKLAIEFTNGSEHMEVLKSHLSLEKAIEKNDIFNIGNGDEVKNISFGLFAAEELVSTSGTSIPADGLIEIISLSENGKAVIKTDLPFGSYYVKELATDEHYILSDSKYPFTFSYAGQDTETVEIAVNDGKPIENKLIYGSVSGKKITENGEALGGAVIGLFKADETEFTKENALMTATSQKDGSFSFEKVPYGNWLVREIEQPEGFVLDETSYEVKISEVAQVIEVEIVNEYVHGNIKLTKVDEDYPDNKLTGATFEVYKDVNGDGKLDDGDELIGTLNETSTGIYEMKEFLYGKYLVRETKAPEGFELDKGVYSVFIEKDEMTYEVENKAGVGFINTAMKGNLKIVKTSSDGKVEGFTFRVTGVNGYDRSFTTDKNGEIVIEGLRIGDYTVSEVQDSVSASYVLPADKIATVKVGSTTVVEMHNELRDTPKTGDNSNVGLWTALAGLSALGIVGTAVVAYRKKKKEDNE